jgi:hypothetical protein
VPEPDDKFNDGYRTTTTPSNDPRRLSGGAP